MEIRLTKAETEEAIREYILSLFEYSKDYDVENISIEFYGATTAQLIKKEGKT